MSNHSALIGSDLPRWTSGNVDAQPVAGMELAGRRRSQACEVLAHRAFQVMTTAGVFSHPSSLHLEILAYADLLNHLVLRGAPDLLITLVTSRAGLIATPADPPTSQLVREASANHIRAAKAGLVNLTPEENAFISDRSIDLVAVRCELNPKSAPAHFARAVQRRGTRGPGAQLLRRPEKRSRILDAGGLKATRPQIHVPTGWGAAPGGRHGRALLAPACAVLVQDRRKLSCFCGQDWEPALLSQSQDGQCVRKGHFQGRMSAYSR